MDHDGDFGYLGGFGDGHVPGDRDTAARAVAGHEGEAVRVVQPGQPVEDGVGERRRPAEEAGAQRLRIRRADRLGELRRVRRQHRTDTDAATIGKLQRCLIASRIADGPFVTRSASGHKASLPRAGIRDHGTRSYLVSLACRNLRPSQAGTSSVWLTWPPASASGTQ